MARETLKTPSANTDLSNYTTIKELNDYIASLTAKQAKQIANGKTKKAEVTGQEILAATNKRNKLINQQTNDKVNAQTNQWTENQDDVNKFLFNNSTIDNNSLQTIKSMVTSSVTGIEGMPYQFSSIVDRRLSGDKPMANSGIGRKYGEKILSRFPLLFMTPCTVDFMKDFGKEEKKTVVDALLTGGQWDQDVTQFLTKSGKYYTVNFAYPAYYSYLNCMLNALAIYLGIGDVKIKINPKKPPVALKSARWQQEVNDKFKTFFSAEENLVFYVDGFSSVSQSFTNDTGDSSLASTINGFADQINEIKFLFGSGNSVMNEVLGMAHDVSTSITSGLSATLGKLGGGIVESLTNNGVNTILNGGKIIFPEIWNNSSMDDGSASFDFKFRSPDNDTLSIYLNVLKPYCKLLCLTMPHQSRKDGNKQSTADPHSYSAPFVLKSSLKGKFAVDTGIISSMSVTKGAECQWNDDGLPTQIDVTIDIKNLYKHMAISGYPTTNNGKAVAFASPADYASIVQNTAYMDFVANMAGLNILEMDMWRKPKFFMALVGNGIKNLPHNLASSASLAISKLMGKLYDFTS